MTTQRATYGLAFAAAALLALAPSAASAQGGIDDVIMRGRVNGVELPRETLEWMRAQGPDAFEVRRGWKHRVAEVRERRAALEAAVRERPVRGAAYELTTAELRRAGAALEGTYRVPVLAGQPSDAPLPFSAADYQDRFFGSGLGQPYTVTSFYAEMSNDLFELTGDVLGWYTLPQNRNFYYNLGDPTFGNTGQFIRHTLDAADPSVDFGIYDNDGPDGIPNSGDDDGFVDAVAFIFPANGRECGGTGEGPWAHRWVVSGWGGGNYSTDDPAAGGGNIRVSDYYIQGGLNCSGGTLAHIGTIAHEAGHSFDLPDLYDTQYNGWGAGVWDLMAGGSYNASWSPAHMGAWSKNFLGWIDVVTIVADTTIVADPILNSHTAYRIDISASPGEYFLLENRQRLGSETSLRGEGLLIWHIDSVWTAQRMNSNTVNNTPTRQGVYVVQADGLNQMHSYNNGNGGDAGDPFPGTSNRTTFGAGTNPSSNGYTTGPSHITIGNIDENGLLVSFDVDVPDLVTYGDVNDDSDVTVEDLDIVMSYAIDATGPDYSFIQIGDVDDDGDVDARDAFIIHAYLEGLNTSQFRVGEQGIE